MTDKSSKPNKHVKSPLGEDREYVSAIETIRLLRRHWYENDSNLILLTSPTKARGVQLSVGQERITAWTQYWVSTERLKKIGGMKTRKVPLNTVVDAIKEIGEDTFFVSCNGTMLLQIRPLDVVYYVLIAERNTRRFRRKPWLATRKDANASTILEDAEYTARILEAIDRLREEDPVGSSIHEQMIQDRADKLRARRRVIRDRRELEAQEERLRRHGEEAEQQLKRKTKEQEQAQESAAGAEEAGQATSGSEASSQPTSADKAEQTAEGDPAEKRARQASRERDFSAMIDQMRQRT